MNISPKRLFDRFLSGENQEDDQVFENPAPKTVLRRRKSLPSFRRGSGMNYSTLPLPIRRKAVTSDSRLPVVQNPENPESRKCQRKSSMSGMLHSGTLDRSRSIRKAKVKLHLFCTHRIR